MANDPMDDDKKKDDGGLALDELKDSRPVKETADDDWDAPPDDIPDKPRSAQDLEAVYDIPVRVSAVLGKSSMQVHELLKLGRGAVVELDRKVGEAIDIYVNDRLVARGEVVVVDDRLGITMTEIIKTQNKS
ncbi:MAG: flagellar motor switch protein FliN [Rhodospirillaceae bacterium]|nr:flagellar motor switch protein FliN [Rhodospirillaceae bacterium]